MTTLRAGRTEIRPYRGDAGDVALLAGWLTDARVLEWFEGRDRPLDAEAVRRRYAPEVLAAEQVQVGIVSDGGWPVGMVQWYPIDPHEYEWHDDPDGVWGVDIVLGDPARWGRGLGTAALTLLVDHLLVTEGARHVVIDPWVGNERAIRAYEKVGFQRAKLLAEHEVHEGEARDCWLMVLDADTHVVALTARFAAIDSVNPSLVPGAPGEAAMGEAVADWALAHGLEVHRQEVAPGRENVVCIRRGRGTGRSLLFNAHLDTVGTAEASTAEVRLGDGRLEGRGVLDTKGGLAAALLAAASFDTGELAGDVIVAGTVDEEYASIGTSALVQRWGADGAVVLEPTEVVVIARHRGFAVLDVQLTGRSAHTSRPERGVNAVHAAMRVIEALRALDERWAVGVDPVERPAVLVSGVRSEGETFTVPATCHLTVEVRTTAASPSAQVGEVMRVVAGAVGDAEVSSSIALARPPVALAADHPFVLTMCAAVGRAEHREAVVGAAPYWTDAALHMAAGTPTVVFGPRGEGLHESLEWVSTDSLRRVTAALTGVARAWCSTDR